MHCVSAETEYLKTPHWQKKQYSPQKFNHIHSQLVAMQGVQLEISLWSYVSILGRFGNCCACSSFWKRLSNETMMCEIEMQREAPWWGYSPKQSLSFHVAGASTSSLSRDTCFVSSWQWRQLLWEAHNGASIVGTHTAHPQTIMCFHQQDCNFQGDKTNRQREKGGGRDVNHAHSNFNQRGRPWGWLTKWWGGNALLLRRNVSLQLRRYDQRLWSRVVWRTCSVPTECHSCVGRCNESEPISQPHIFCYMRYASKWPRKPKCVTAEPVYMRSRTL